MEQNSETCKVLNEKWKGACRVVLGGEVGEFKEYAKWLYEGNGPRGEKKSSLSGREVTFSIDDYEGGAGRLSFDEVDFNKKYPPLNINEIKDTDSLIRAISERIYYTGDLVLGNSQFVEKSTNIIDSFYIHNSERIAYSKYIAYCTFGSFNENMFGSYSNGNCEFCIKCSNIINLKRCLCTVKSDYSSDCIYSFGLENCSDCIFCFNARNKRFAIGNLELPKEKYKKIKQKLLGEIREKLTKEKRLPSLIELTLPHKPDFDAARKAVSESSFKLKRENQDKRFIEKAFTSTFRIIFGKEPKPIDNYGEWLSRHVIKTTKAASCLSSEPVIVPQYAPFPLFPKERLITECEAEALGEKLHIDRGEAERITFENAPKTISKISFYSTHREAGISTGNIDCIHNTDSTFCYRNVLSVNGKLCAYCFLPRISEHLFGCSEGRSSSFCIHCYRSGRLSRCFEVDASNDCADCLFCHNCENVHDGMFCFNVKNLKYAIGNVEVGREKYIEIKKKVLAELNENLEKKGGLEISIFNLMGKMKGH